VGEECVYSINPLLLLSYTSFSYRK